MDRNELKALLLERLHVELCLFKDSMLRSEKEDIYEASYKIEVYIGLYEILLDEVEELEEGAMRELLYRRCGILKALYLEWLEWEDGFVGQLCSCVRGRLEIITREAEVSCRKERENGEREGTDQAA